MRLTRVIAGFLLLPLAAGLAPVRASAQDVVTEGCLEQVYGRMAHEERLFRSVLFGQEKSEDLPEGSVRFNDEYATWLKTGENQWRSLDPGYEGTTWSDALMDEQADVQARRGIFETKKTPTSDLIPSMLQSMRALQCRLRAVCAGMRASQQEMEKPEDERADTVSVQPDGCLEFELPVMTSCQAGNVAQLGPGTCDSAVEAIMERESKLLHMTVAYDAAYRTLAQFAGIFEGFLNDFRFPLLQPLWQMIRALGSLDGLPCFNGQCDE